MVFARLYRAFPDLQTTVVDLIAEGDKVVERETVTGTHQGEYMGLPATGRAVAYNDIFVMWLVNGRIAEIWGASTSSRDETARMLPAQRSPVHSPSARECQKIVCLRLARTAPAAGCGLLGDPAAVGLAVTPPRWTRLLSNSTGVQH
jgi:hypothetical protein